MIDRFISAYSAKRQLAIDFSDVDDCCKQSFGDECDINHIMKRYERTGVLEHRASIEPQYGDVSDTPDFQSALDIVNQGRDMFASMDSLIRDRFANDPVRFMQFVEDPRNQAEGIALGIFDAPAIPSVIPIAVIDPVAP